MYHYNFVAKKKTQAHMETMLGPPPKKKMGF